MDPLFPPLSDAWVLAEDDAWIFVAKPPGIPSQAPDPEVADDIVSRLREHLSSRDGGAPPYLGVHQRLDRDTSGVMVFAKTKAANRPIAAAFEGRAVEKQYVAAVAGWPRGRAHAVLEDWLAGGDDGRARVVGKGGKRAVTHVRVRGHVGGRSLLELTLVTGRTHQARVQLAHAGAPIAGDVLYDGPPAPRLLLHAERIRLPHPGSGELVAVTAELPREFQVWLERGDLGPSIYDDLELLDSAIRRALDRRYGLGRRNSGPRATTAFRVVHEAGDGLPGLAVDHYAGYAVAQFYEDEGGSWTEARRERVCEALERAGFRAVYVKRRPKEASKIVDPRREEFAPPLPVRGALAPSPLIVNEEGIPLVVRLGDGLQTGIFLDQRANRARVRSLAGGTRFLNLFAFTCGFTVAAARGGALESVSVDASLPALEWGRENLRNADIDLAPHKLVCDDAFSWLARAAKKGERFDLVVLDPPSYATTRSRRFVLSSDLPELVALALAVTSPSGRLLVSINHRKTSRARFRRLLLDATTRAGWGDAAVRDAPDPPDYPEPPGAEPTTKSAWIAAREKSKRPL